MLFQMRVILSLKLLAILLIIFYQLTKFEAPRYNDFEISSLQDLQRAITLINIKNVFEITIFKSYRCLVNIRKYTIIQFLGKMLQIKLAIMMCTAKSYETMHENSNNVVCVTSKASNQPGHTRSLIRGFTSCLSIL